MSDTTEPSTRLELAHVLFMDLVGYSRLPLEQQNRRVGALQEIVRGVPAYEQAAGDGSVLSHPAGDGMALAFFHDPSAPARCALEVALEVASRDDLPLRMGIHTGPVYRAEDINRTANVRGPGINLAQRVMDCGDAGHILLSYTSADALLPLAAWEDRLHDLGEAEVKHGLALRIYSLVDRDLGRAERPTRLREQAERWATEHAKHNLPAALTSFVGRDEQIAEAKDRLRETRLLTLTGTGGTGKTRLSIRIGEDLLDEYPDGVWFVELASISDPALIVNAVAAVLDVRDSAEQTLMQTLVHYLRGQRALVILDNCEHLVEGAARFAQEFLTACPGPQILATSREVLGVNGEATWRVPSLALPGRDGELDHADMGAFEAVRLFVDRARAARGDFALTEENTATVVAICRRLDGIPLAIELAAARVRAMSLGDIHDRLDERFRLLTGGGRASPRRQQTLRALVDWSYRLLDDPEQALFARLSVFQGGFTLAAAEDVCAFGDVETWDVMDLLLRMVDKSLAIAEEGPSGTRYRMLETLREYGLERIVEGGEAEEVRQRHARHYFALVSELRPEFVGPKQVEAFDRLEEDHDNLRGALTWAEHGDRALGLQAVHQLHWFWHERGHWVEARDIRDRYLDDRSGLPKSLVGHVLVGRAWVGALLDEHDVAWEACQEATRLFEAEHDAAGAASAMYITGIVRGFRGDGSHVAIRHFEDALEQFRALNHEDVMLGLATLPMWVIPTGDVTRGAALLDDALTYARENGCLSASSVLMYHRARLEVERQEFDAAEASLDQAFVLHRQIHSLNHEQYSRELRGLLSGFRGDYAAAYAYHAGALPLCRRLAQIRAAGRLHHQLATWARMLGRYADAETHYREAGEIFADVGADWRTLSVEFGRAGICLALADGDGAARHLCPAFAGLEEQEEPRLKDEALLYAAQLARLNGLGEIASRLLAFVDQWRASDERELDPVFQMVRVHEDLAGELRRQLEEELWEDAYAAACEAGERMTLDEAMAVAREVLGS